MNSETVNFKHSIATVNENRVPQKQWRKWNIKARRVFNDLYSSLMDSQLWLPNSLQKKITPQEHKVISWNAAWLAADAAKEADV